MTKRLRRVIALLSLMWTTACGGQVVSGATHTSASLAVILPSSTARATFSPQMLTPIPTNTPAPTPTPVVHIVQPGDTLLGIALQYGVTLDALQQINGVLRPETLQIGQLIIIPIGQLSASNTGGAGQFLLPTPAPAAVVITNTARYLTPVGSLWVLGEVYNPTDQPLENVQVRVGLMDEGGREVASDLTFTVLDFVPATGSSPFGILFTEPPQGVAGFQAIIVRAEPSYNNVNRYAQLQVTAAQIERAGAAYRVTGTATNSGASNAVDALIAVTVYDADRRVTGYRLLSLPDEQLTAGAAAQFDVTVAPDPSVPDVADFGVVAQARSQ
jgi:murein DD-endopeptidase MepM/ murein hydrolase activator NlpD